MVGAAFGAILYNKEQWGWGLPIWGIFLFNGMVPLVAISPFFYHLVEVQPDEEPPRYAILIAELLYYIILCYITLQCDGAARQYLAISAAKSRLETLLLHLHF